MNRIDGLSVAELVTSLDGVTIVGDPAVMCHDALPLCDAIEGCVTMISEISRCGQLDQCGAVAVVTSKYSDRIRCTQIIVDDVHQAFTAIVKQFRHSSPSVIHAAIDSTAQIAPTATIGVGTRVDAGVVIGAGVTIGCDCHLMAGVVVMDNTIIGDHCTFFPKVVIYEHTRIEHDVIIHAGSIIGAHGFGYQLVNGRHLAKAQLGFVHIDAFVEIGANVTVDRGTYGATRIGEGTKIDNLVQIAHNCQIGKHNLICSQVGLAGSCKTGDYVILAGQVGIADHITIGNHAIVGAQAGVMENLEGKQTYLGSPATPRREQMQILATQRKLPEMRKELRTLRRDVDNFLTSDVENNEVHQSARSLEAITDSDDAEEHPRCLQFKRPAA